jgi:hypothetical protein
MTNTTIVVEISSLQVRAKGPATANLWVVIAGREFPSRGWNDFVVVILSWWAKALVRIFCGESTQESVHFMDGPYSIEISGSVFGMLQFRALEGPRRTQEAALGSASACEFAKTLISQGREVLEKCKNQNWWSLDATTLESSLLSLEQQCQCTFSKN